MRFFHCCFHPSPRRASLLFSIVFSSFALLTYHSLTAATPSPATPTVKQVRLIIAAYRQPLPDATNYLKTHQATVDLGRMLFYDKRLSPTQTVSCNDCHDLARYGVNGQHYLNQVKDGKAWRDIPTVYNKAAATQFGWTGYQTTLKEKIAHSLQNPHEMNIAQPDRLITRLNSIKGYGPLFAKAFPNAPPDITLNQVIESLTDFHYGLSTPAPIDDFLNGNDDALTPRQLIGAKRFDDKACSACHTGNLFGAQMQQKTGAKYAWPNQSDQGRFLDTHQTDYKMFFRVSPLRNVEKTAPYFHDRSSSDLPSAIARMAWHELGTTLTEQEAGNIAHFLNALTGDLPTTFVAPPKLPQ